MKIREIPKLLWQYKIRGKYDENLIKVFKGNGFCVQVRQHGECIRLSINRIKHFIVDGKPQWEDKITWDELQDIKNQCGYEDKWLCEYYPPEDKVINVANIRHLWLMDKPPENSLN